MNQTKFILLFILFVISGLIFTAAGFYISSDKYAKKISEYVKEVKAAGRASIGMGLVTILFGIGIFFCPSASNVLLITYLVILLITVSAVEIFIKTFSKK